MEEETPEEKLEPEAEAPIIDDCEGLQSQAEIPESYVDEIQIEEEPDLAVVECATTTEQLLPNEEMVNVTSDAEDVQDDYALAEDVATPQNGGDDGAESADELARDEEIAIVQQEEECAPEEVCCFFFFT